MPKLTGIAMSERDGARCTSVPDDGHQRAELLAHRVPVLGPQEVEAELSGSTGGCRSASDTRIAASRLKTRNAKEPGDVPEERVHQRVVAQHRAVSRQIASQSDRVGRAARVAGPHYPVHGAHGR